MSETTETPVTMSRSAAKRISAILADEPGKVLRVAVEGGGCSGFSYSIDLGEREAEDLVIERDGAVVVIDPTSLPFLEGSEIDFTEELIGAAFKIHNPNATAACGCGTSFSV